MSLDQKSFSTRQELPFENSSVARKQPSITRVNAEPAYGSRLVTAETSKATYKTHRSRVDSIQGSIDFSDEPYKPEFLEGKISKNFWAQFETQKIAKANQSLLAKLSAIQDEPVRRRLARLEALRAQGPSQTRTRMRERMRGIRNTQISRANDKQLQKLKLLKPTISTRKLAKARVREEKVLWLRQTDYTSGHLLKAPKTNERAQFETFGEKQGFDQSLDTDINLPDTDAMRRASVTDRTSTQALQKNLLPPLESPQKSPPRPSPKKKKKSPQKKKKFVPDEIPLLKLMEEKEEEIHIDLPDAKCMHQQRQTFVVDSVGEVPCTTEVWAAEPYTILTEVEVIMKSTSGDVITEQARCISDWTVKYGGAKMVESHDIDARAMAEMLAKMFKEADEDDSGELSHEEFFGLMEEADLGLNRAELQLLMQEADEDGDGTISYEEFMPIAIDLVASFKARKVAKRASSAESRELDATVNKKLEAPELEKRIAEAERMLGEADKRGTGSMTRPEFRKHVKKTPVPLNKSEFAALLKKMPLDAFGKFVYSKFRKTVKQVKFDAYKCDLIMKRGKGTTTGDIMELCRHSECEILKTEAEDPNASEEFDPHDPAYTFLLSSKQFELVLRNEKLGLTGLQVMSLLADAPFEDCQLDYVLYAPRCARAIDHMLDPAAMAAKVDVLSSHLSQEKAFGGKSEADLARELNALFASFDVDGSGCLDGHEFGMAMQSLNLGLDQGDIDYLLLRADADAKGTIDRKEFMQFTMGELLDLVKAKHQKNLHQDLDQTASNQELREDVDMGVNASSFDQLVDRDLSPDQQAEMQQLLEMFRRADTDKNGSLSANEFHRLLEALDLGLTQYQMARLMAEADENDDGCISYSEFVPVMLKNLETYRSKQSAGKEWKERMEKAEAQAESAQSVLRQQLEETIHVLEGAFREAAKLEAAELGDGTSPHAYPSLKRDNFLKCLASPKANLDRHMINMIAARIKDKDGKTPTKGVKDAVFTCHLENCKRQVLEQITGSSMEEHLRHMLGNAEKKHAQEQGRTDESRSKILPAKKVHELISEAKELPLTRQQLLAVMSLQAECSIDDDEVSDSKPVDIVPFCAKAAKMIADFFDVGHTKRRAQLANSARTNADELLGGRRADDLEAKLTSAFQRKDLQGRGHISLDDFRQVIQSITILDFTRGEIAAILTNAPRDKEGHVVWNEFLTQARDIFALIAKERHEKALSMHDAHFDPHGDVQPLDEDQVVALGRALAEAASLAIDPNDPDAFIINFEELKVPELLQGGKAGMMAALASPQGKEPEVDVLADDPWGRSEECVLAEEERDVACVNTNDEEIDINHKVMPQNRAMAADFEQLQKRMHIKILRNKDMVEIEATCQDTSHKFEHAMRMPSIAIVDSELGRSFVKRVMAKVRVEVNDALEERLKV